MNRTPEKEPLTWSEIYVLAMLAGLVLFGLAASCRSPLQFLAGIGYGGALLLIGWLWQYTLRQAEKAPPLTRRQWAWNATVFFVWRAVIALLVWLFL